MIPIRLGVNILFTVGGDGTQRGGNELFQEAKKRGHALSVVGIPKTVDNDVAFVTRTFGYLTAVQEAANVLHRAHTEARSVQNGIVNTSTDVRPRRMAAYIVTEAGVCRKCACSCTTSPGSSVASTNACPRRRILERVGSRLKSRHQVAMASPMPATRKRTGEMAWACIASITAAL